MPELSVDLVKSQLSSQQRFLVNEEVVGEIQKLAENPDYGDEFLDAYLTHLNVLKESVNSNHAQYLSAVKFFTLVESGNSLTDAYVKVFPSRYDDRKQNHPPQEQNKTIMRSEASRYNKSVLVNEIRKVAAYPVHLIHRHLLHEAILVQADLMNNARSEMVRQKAASALITELKPSEDHQLNIKVEDNSTSIIDELRKATEALVAKEHQFVMAGGSMQDVANSNIIEGEIEEVD